MDSSERKYAVAEYTEIVSLLVIYTNDFLRVTLCKASGLWTKSAVKLDAI